MSQGKTLVIGVDVAWWGGSKAKPDSQNDVVVAGVVGGDSTTPLEVDVLALNPLRERRGAAGFDPAGELLLKAIADTVKRHGHDRCVVALDAPLHHPDRAARPRRLDMKSGFNRRPCEDALQAAVSTLGRAGKEGGGWRAGIKIQAGSPPWPRIQAIVRGLGDIGMPLWLGGEPTGRDVIEIFPSEAIWSLGIAGHFGAHRDECVRAYKRKGDQERLGVRCDACNGRPMTFDDESNLALSGFAGVLDGAPWFDGACKIVTDVACARTAGSERRGPHKGKGFDDTIDSGIAFLTGACFALGRYHVWAPSGADCDQGVIVGPGVL